MILVIEDLTSCIVESIAIARVRAILPQTSLIGFNGSLDFVGRANRPGFGMCHSSVTIGGDR
jgi:hypothetical protein